MTDRLAAVKNGTFGKSLVLFTITGKTNGRYYVERFYELPEEERDRGDWITNRGLSGKRWIKKSQVMFFPKDEEAFVELGGLYENFTHDTEEERQHWSNKQRIRDEFYLSVVRANLLVDRE